MNVVSVSVKLIRAHLISHYALIIIYLIINGGVMFFLRLDVFDQLASVLLGDRNATRNRGDQQLRRLTLKTCSVELR